MEFKCTGDNLEQIPKEIIETGLSFPKAHFDRQNIANLAKALRVYRGDVITRVPFCVTVEAEAFGAKIKMGDENSGPRVESYKFSSIDEMVSLEKIDVTSGRISEVLEAVQILAKQGEKVSLSVEGPFTIISSLIDPLIFYKSVRKEPEKVRKILQTIEESIVSYSIEGIKRGAVIISYGDPVGSLDIVGPKTYREFSGPSSLNIIDNLMKLNQKVIIHLCGKTSTGLEKSELAKFYPQETEGETYGEALLKLYEDTTKATVVGHRCIKWSKRKIGQPVFWMLEQL